MVNKFCPKCKSNNVTLYCGGAFNSYICKDCGYIGSLVLEKFNSLPKFDDGRIDYSKSRKAPVIMCFVKYKNEILILKSGDKVLVYKGKWNGVGGYLDDEKTVKEKALEEIKEELGINKKDVLNVKLGEPYEFYDKDVKRTWFMHPVLVNLKKKVDIKLDWEHTEYRWIDPKDLKKFDIVKGLDKALKSVI